MAPTNNPPAGNGSFPEHALTAEGLFLRSYSRRKEDGHKESWKEATKRQSSGIVQLGKLTDKEAALIYKMALSVVSLPSGRWLWVGGTDHILKPKNFPSAYNCSSTNLDSWDAFGYMMDLAMQGCGTGAVLTPENLDQLPPICNRITVQVMDSPGDDWDRNKEAITKGIMPDDGKTIFFRGEDREGIFPEDMWNDFEDGHLYLYVGDSREGWVEAYLEVLKASAEPYVKDRKIVIHIYLGNVRPAGLPLKGFGGVSNPIGLPRMFERIGEILKGAYGRKLNTVEACLLVDEAASCIVAGSIRRCIAKGELVFSQSGLIPIERIRVGDRVLTSKGFYPVTNFFDQGVQMVSRIVTQDGYFDCTPDHKVAVMSSIYGEYRMVKTKDLKAGDRLVFVPGGIPGLPTELPEFVARKKANGEPTGARSITVPALTEDIAYFFGYLHGNGSVNSDGYRVRISMPIASLDIALAILETVKKFGIDASLPKPKKAVYELQFSYSALNEYLKQFKVAFSSPIVPEAILCGIKSIRASYLAGLMDSDGTPSTNVLLSSSHENHIRVVQQLYGSLGIPARLSSALRKRTGAYEWELNVVGQYRHTIREIVGSRTIRCAQNFGGLTQGSRNMYGFPREMVKASISGINWSQMEKQKTQECLRTIDPQTTDLVPVEILEVRQETREVATYDIEVAGVHEFVCSGILVSNSAGIRQGSEEDTLFASAKQNLWTQNENDKWVIDPKRDALRMANHTRVYHHRPTYKECLDSVTDQFQSGEGAVQYAPMAIARASADILDCPEKVAVFVNAFNMPDPQARDQKLNDLLAQFDDCEVLGVDWQTLKFKTKEECVQMELSDRLKRFGLNPCAEILLSDNFCNLSDIHLNQIDPLDILTQEDAFHAGALNVAALLHHKFTIERYQQSRTLDPIVGVSVTGLFDFFVNLFGSEWLRWWQAGRPQDWEETEKGHLMRQFKPFAKGNSLEHFASLSDYFEARETNYMEWWKSIVRKHLFEYCDRHGLKRPNRYTTLQPSGSKALLTGASPGWHPPKAKRYVRRMTFGAGDPLAMAHIDMGYTVIPGQKDKDELGQLLDDPFDSRCTEWLVEFPIEMPWANLPGIESIEIEKFSAVAQLSFWMNVQKYYAGHNVSATCELTEEEIPEVAEWLYQSIRSGDPYISTTFLARFDAPFPRLPFEKIDRETYLKLRDERLERWKANGSPTMLDRLKVYDVPHVETGPQDAACSSGSCEFRATDKT